ncbi:MAG TPA: ribonuclease III [Stellaceae bacterium]|nr:ribonuclease III [Stellaceae bacterium]
MSTNGEPTAAAGDDLAQRIGHVFARPALLAEALTHPSAVAQVPGGRKRRRRTPPPQGYERLEFLGDRVLALVVADLLWRRHPDEPEGHLSRRHVQLVRREALARVATELQLDRHIVVAASDAAAGTAKNSRVLGDVCEAVIAAIYIDGGYAAAARFIERFWTALIAEIEAAPPVEPKNALQAWAERRGLGLPVYRLISAEGPDHARRFTVGARVAESEEATATASTKRAAEAEAAAGLLSLLTHDG